MGSRLRRMNRPAELTLLRRFKKPMGRIELPSVIYETTALPLSYIGRAGEENRTPAITLGRSRSATKLHPRSLNLSPKRELFQPKLLPSFFL